MFSQNSKIALCFQGAANSVDCDVINFGDFLDGCFVVIHTGAADTDLVLSLFEADDVNKTNAQAITQDCEIFADLDAGTTSDVLVRQTAAKAYTIDTGEAPDQIVVIQVPPEKLSDGKPCCYLADSGGNASNDCTIFWIGRPRYAGETLPAAIS